MRKGTKVTIDELAGMVKYGFEHVDARLANLETGQETILLRLTNVAYRFELVDLEKRVYRLEHKTSITRK